MAIQKIEFQNKVAIDEIGVPEKNKITANNINEIKAVVNNNADILKNTEEAVSNFIENADDRIGNTEENVENLQENTYTKNEVNYLLESKADKSEIPTDLSQLSNNTTQFVNEEQLNSVDINLQNQIDAITASSDVVDIVGTYQELQNYDTSHLGNNDIVKVLEDSTHNNAVSYYRWKKNTNEWQYIGSEGPYYTKGETDTLLNEKVNKEAGKGLSQNDFTNTLKNKLDGIELNAQVNVIESIKVNGTIQSIENKSVNINVPTKTSDLNNDSGFIDKDVNDLENYYTKNDTYTKQETNTLLDNKENKLNKTDVLNSSSTNTQYPSAKLVYDELSARDEEIEVLKDEDTKFRNILIEKQNINVEDNDITLTDTTEGLDIKVVEVDSNKLEQKTSLLPDEYQEVEYIESTGTQYIDTGIIGTGNIGFDIEWETNDANTILGCRKAYNENQYQLSTYTGSNIVNGYFGYGTGGNGGGKWHRIYYNYGHKNHISFINNVLTLNDGTTQIINSENFSTANTLVIFACKASTDGNIFEYTASKLYTLKFYDGSILIRNFIPCYRKSDGEIGLYDLVNNVFKTNAGTGTFLKGNDVTRPSIEYPSNITGITGDVIGRVIFGNYFDIGNSLEGYTKTTVNGTKISDTSTSFVTALFENYKVTFSNYQSTGYPWISKFIKLPRNTDLILKGNTNSDFKIVGFNSNERDTIGTQLTLINAQNTESEFNSGNYNYYMMSFYPDNKFFENIEIIRKTETRQNYIPYKNQPITLSLGNKTLYKGDGIAYRNNKWRIVSKIGDVNLKDVDGYLQSINSYGIANYLFTNIESNVTETTIDIDNFIAYSNRFKKQKTTIANTSTEGFLPSINAENQKAVVFLRVNSNVADNFNDLKNWLTNNPTHYYWKRYNPIETEITDTTLLSQLNNLLKLKQYNDTTIIEFDEDVFFDIEIESEKVPSHFISELLNDDEEREIATVTGASINITDSAKKPCMIELTGNMEQDGEPSISTPIPFYFANGEYDVKKYNNNNQEFLPIDLKNYKLAKVGTSYDHFNISYIEQFGYKKITSVDYVKETADYIFTGNESFSIQNYNKRIALSTKTNNMPLAKIISDNDTIFGIYCNILKNTTANNTWNGVEGISYDTNTNNNIINISINSCTTAEQYQQALKGNSVLYELATPVTTPVTDGELIKQLEVLINTFAYHGVTNVDVLNEDGRVNPNLKVTYEKSNLIRLENLENRIALLEE